ncbi:hypothetical protein TRIUR3_24611 [Triticum urartu]|uniref:PHD-type zinc finger plants domain-containing protein n=1 Tax=Triticum urartu TaxID=4572 RepID=M8A6P4_TRIUA|nr:hypothetical protein TRIUR3_24611 [Triticum urartu]
MEPPPSPLGAGACAVCCMCGDRGLPHELLRCKLCRVRLQHRYCSDLYPRATAYRRCNWCLREPAEAHAQAHAQAQLVASKKAEKRKMVQSTETSTSDEEARRQHEAGCATATRSRRSAAEIGGGSERWHVGAMTSRDESVQQSWSVNGYPSQHRLAHLNPITSEHFTLILAPFDDVDDATFFILKLTLRVVLMI